jgi:hypothetical protein
LGAVGACKSTGASGASGKVAHIADRRGPDATAQHAIAKAEVRLLEAGAEPRAPLRYRLKEGQKERLLLEMATGLKLAVGDKAPPVPVPKVRLTIEVRAHPLPPNLILEGVVSQVEVVEEPGLPALMVKAVRSDLDGLGGTQWKASFTDSGQLFALHLPVPADANNQLVRTLESLRDALRLLLVPLPEGPVGTNARWQARRRAAIATAAVDETATYQLGAAEGHGLVAITLALSAPEQPLTLPLTSPGTTARLASFEGSGKGEVQLDLFRIVQPTTLRWTATARGEGRPPGEPPAPITLEVESTTTVRRK